jgi:Domain of unknown function (DUF3291)
VEAEHHLAQVNVALPREPLESPLLAEFVAALEPLNAIADRSLGFVWRLQTEEGDATSIRVFEDERIIVNLSVWESLEALRAFVYGRPHREYMARRREWFEQMADAYLALWWVPAGHIPSVEEAKDRLRTLRRDGPGPEAFSFRVHFPPPGQAAAGPVLDERELCPSG